MINEYIEQGLYKEALDLLTNMEDEQVRYLRLVCLFGLQEFYQAKQEAIVAKSNAKETYYDVVAMQVSVLKELEEFEEAIDILIEELSMPYIPYQYETTFNNAYDEVLLAKQEANIGMETKTTIFTMDEIESVLQRDQINEDILYMIIDQLRESNIRRVLPAIRSFLVREDQPHFAKTLLLEILIEQKIDEEIEISKNKQMFECNPSYQPYVLEQEVVHEVLEMLSRNIEDDNPSMYELCHQFATLYFYSVFPSYVDDSESSIIAAAIHYHVATLQYVELEMEDIQFLYDVDGEEVLKKVEDFNKIIE